VAGTPQQPQSAGGGDAPADDTPGDAPATEVMTTTSTRQVVSVDLDATKQSLARVGASVEVELPDGDVAQGRISSVSRVAERSSGDGGSGGGPPEGEDSESTATIPLTITLRGGRGTGRLDEAPVSVRLAAEVRRDVLAVPVTALLAVAGGGYAVEVAGTDGGRRRIAVTPGLFADGYVEVEGRGLRPGMRVVNAA
jgi:multidrug efflux pump subunit AcrA (membrane-fusion protein)